MLPSRPPELSSEEVTAMQLLAFARKGSLAFALVLLFVPLPVRAQETTEAATRQYNAAVGLHKSADYGLAADMWLSFISNFKRPHRALLPQLYGTITDGKAIHSIKHSQIWTTPLSSSALYCS